MRVCAVLAVMTECFCVVDRTFPEQEAFQGPSAVKIKLLRVLACYAMYNPAVGYCQGQ